MNRYRVPHNVGRHMISRRQPNMYAIFLFFQLLERISALEPKPPVTMILIIFNLFIFYSTRLLTTNAAYLPTLLISYLRPFLSTFKARNACIIPAVIVSSRSQYKRLILAAFTHLSDIHVLYNCSSLLYKGVALEPVMGSLPFFGLILYLALTSHIFYVGVAFAARSVGIHSTVNTCVSGFSAVLFGLKVILNANPRYARVSRSSMFGMQMPAGPIAPWFELVITSVVMPNVSFLGHLCGIFAGLSYVIAPKLIARVITLFINLRPARHFQGTGRHLHGD